MLRQMPRSPSTLTSLALLAMLTVSLPSLALAQDKNPPRNQAPAAEEEGPAAEEAPAAESDDTSTASADFEVSVPSVESVGANLDEETLRAIFSGDVEGHADELAGLEADSITIPQIVITYSVPEGEDGPQNGEITYRDIALNDVTAGVASSVSIGGASVTNSEDVTVELGEMSTGLFDIGATLRLYGLVEGEAGGELQTLYEDFAFTGGTLSSPDIECEFGGITVAEFRARPLKMSFGELMALAETMEAEGEEPSPENLRRFIDFYADFINAFESSPMEFDGFDCSGETEDGKPMEISFGSLTMGGFGQGRYPEVTGNDLQIVVDEDGGITLDEFVLKSFDLSGVVATLQNAAEELSDSWFENNFRSVIPPFEGFSFAGLSVDVPDEENPGQRIRFGVGDFDLSLSGYVNGVPSDISSSASDIEVAVPEDSEDETLKQLDELGIDSFDLGYDFQARWNEADQTITVEQLSLSDADLGAVALSATLGNATADLFSNDTNLAMMASMGLTLRDLSVTLEDDGLADKLLEKTASDQGTDVATLQSSLAGTAQGTILVLLAGTEGAEQLAEATAAFVKGADSMSVLLTAIDEAGLGMADFMAIQEDPTALKGKVSIEASAQ